MTTTKNLTGLTDHLGQTTIIRHRLDSNQRNFTMCGRHTLGLRWAGPGAWDVVKATITRPRHRDCVKCLNAVNAAEAVEAIMAEAA
jgi:hypothetical protein